MLIFGNGAAGGVVRLAGAVVAVASGPMTLCELRLEVDAFAEAGGVGVLDAVFGEFGVGGEVGGEA